MPYECYRCGTSENLADFQGKIICARHFAEMNQ